MRNSLYIRAAACRFASLVLRLVGDPDQAVGLLCIALLFLVPGVLTMEGGAA